MTTHGRVEGLGSAIRAASPPGGQFVVGVVGQPVAETGVLIGRRPKKVRENPESSLLLEPPDTVVEYPSGLYERLGYQRREAVDQHARHEGREDEDGVSLKGPDARLKGRLIQPLRIGRRRVEAEGMGGRSKRQAAPVGYNTLRLRVRRSSQVPGTRPPATKTKPPPPHDPSHFARRGPGGQYARSLGSRRSRSPAGPCRARRCITGSCVFGTNVASELMLPEPAAAVAAWIGREAAEPDGQADGQAELSETRHLHEVHHIRPARGRMGRDVAASRGGDVHRWPHHRAWGRGLSAVPLVPIRVAP